MHELLRLAGRLRCACPTPELRFRRQMRVGLLVAALILLLSLVR